MKKAIIFCGLFIAILQVVSAQSNKTNLSLQVSSAAAANRKQLASYVWTRTIQVFVDGTLKNTIVSSISIGPDGKMVTTAVSSTPTDPPPTRGIRGDIARKKMAEMKTYIDNAMKTTASYIYLSTGKMVDYFNAASISQSGNTITVVGSNVNQTDDQLTMKVATGTYAYISQSFASTVTGGDAITGNCNYKTFSNGLTAFNSGELDLPAKNMKLMVSNTGYAKKLQ
ncbi:MAG TPA: hypothetical protein VFI33_06175 [Puia sp.]|nr:hypothetical protein [Puia sp.]